MKLLIVTQVIDLDDPVLGFFHRWVEEFAKHVERVEVICLKEGRHELPENVHVHSLGKEEGRPRFGRLSYAIRFRRLNRKLRDSYDSVFVHMNPEYVILGGFRWRRAHKKVVLWYSHRHLGLRFTLAKFLVQNVATTAKETLGLKNKKIVVCGHGIELEPFLQVAPHALDVDHPKMVTVGRITKIKNIDTIIRTVSLLRLSGVEAHLDIIGAPVTKKDKKYEAFLRKLVRSHEFDSQVSFIGAIPHEELPERLAQYDISINASKTGVDKAVLESMASGLPTFISDFALRDYFGELFDRLVFVEESETSLTEAVRDFLHASDKELVHTHIRDLARRNFSVETLIPRIVTLLS